MVLLLLLGAKVLVMLVGFEERDWFEGEGCGNPEGPRQDVSICLSTICSFMRFQQIGHATKPSLSLTSGSGSGSGVRASRRAISAVASMPLDLLRRAEVRNLLLNCCSFASSTPFAFRFGVAGGRDCGGGLCAKSRTAARVCVNAATTSSMDQLLRSLVCCSEARHSGHFPSVERARRMQREQKV